MWLLGTELRTSGSVLNCGAISPAPRRNCSLISFKLQACEYKCPQGPEASEPRERELQAALRHPVWPLGVESKSRQQGQQSLLSTEPRLQPPENNLTFQCWAANQVGMCVTLPALHWGFLSHALTLQFP